MMKRMVILRRCHPPPPPPPPAVLFGGCCGVRYGECRRNHAVSMGGHAVDGCREFLDEGEEGTTAALRCAACACHRSFHRRMVQRCCYCDAGAAVAVAASAGRWDDDCSPESSAYVQHHAQLVEAKVSSRPPSISAASLSLSQAHAL